MFYVLQMRFFFGANSVAQNLYRRTRIPGNKINSPLGFLSIWFQVHRGLLERQQLKAEKPTDEKKTEKVTHLLYKNK